jgi:protoporphyrinogen oxidase
MSRPTVILGAGMSGLATAYFLEKDYLLFEEGDRAGGLCRSEHADGFTFDHAGHVLHFSEETNRQVILELLDDNVVRHERSAWVWWRGAWTRFPFQCHLHGLPSSVIRECIDGLRGAGQKPATSDQPLNFREWLLSTFGEGLARHFMFPFNEKLWRVPLHEMSSDWAERMIPMPTPAEVVAGAEGRATREFGYNAVFYYPAAGGIECLARAFASKTDELRLGCEAVQVLVREKEVHFRGGAVAPYDHLVSTLPLPVIVGLLDAPPKDVVAAAGRLRHVSVYNLNLGVDQPALSGKHWAYFPDADIVFYRVGSVSNVSPSTAPAGCGSLSVEVSYAGGSSLDREWTRDKIFADLRRTDVLPDGTSIRTECPLDIEYAYPVHDLYRASSVATIREYLAAHDIYSIGRHGTWEYMSISDVVGQARRLATRVRGT